MSNVVIRHAQAEDAVALYDLRHTALKTNPEAFGADWQEMEANHTVESYAERIPSDESDNCLIVAEQEGELVGMMGLVRPTRLKTKHDCVIWGVFVRPEARGHSIGAKMLHAIMAHVETLEGVKQVSLSVITANEAAIALYEKFGFVTWGTQANGLYVDGVFHDMYYMAYVVPSAEG